MKQFNYSRYIQFCTWQYVNKLRLKKQKCFQKTLGIKIPGLSYIFADCSQIVSGSWDDTLRGEEVHNKHTNKPAYLPSLSESMFVFLVKVEIRQISCPSFYGYWEMFDSLMIQIRIWRIYVKRRSPLEQEMFILF